MSLQTDFEHRFFSTFRTTLQQSLQFQINVLAQRYGLRPEYIRQRLVRWHQDGLIHLTAFNVDRGYQSWDRWDGHEPFFATNSNGNYFQAELLADGADLAENLQKEPIGFLTRR